MAQETGFLDRETQERPYVVFVPKGVKKPWPTILFLHGAGECGVDGLRQVAVGLPPAIMLDRGRWPFLVVIPQKKEVRDLWKQDREYLDAVLHAVEKEFEPDPHRRYLTGLSQGGRGTFDLVKSLAWQFAAAAPVCGWADLEQVAKDFRDVPLWAFHGEDDNVVPLKGSRDAVEAILAAGGTAKITTYPETGHNSWDAAYRESELPAWLLEHHL